MTMFAQNDKISYQAVVRDTANRLVANKSVQVTVNIYNGTATTAAYTETQTVTTNLNGLISLQIGPNGTNASWNSIEWNKARIETTVKLNGTQLGTLAMPLTAVPYAMYAKEISPDAALIKDLMHADTALANRIVADSNSLILFKEKVHADSVALGALIEANVAAINNLQNADANLSQRIAADSNNLVYFKAKENADSLALAGQITALSNSVDNKTAALSDRIAADSNRLVNLSNSVDSAKANIRGEIGNSADSLNTKIGNLANSVDSAKANIRGEIGNSADSLNTKINNLANSVDSAKANIRGEIGNSADSLNTKINNLANSVDSAKTNIRAEIAALSNNIASTYITTADATTIAQNLASTLTTTLNALNARIDSVINVMNNLPTRMVEQRDTVQTAGQTTFTLAHKARTDCVVKLYINGVMVGGNYNGVVTVANNNNQTTVTYVPAKNGNYALKADDKVTIVYWY
jgi:predicted  nucleic acid-binding Zn-ribbon protein